MISQVAARKDETQNLPGAKNPNVSASDFFRALNDLSSHVAGKGGLKPVHAKKMEKEELFEGVAGKADGGLQKTATTDLPEIAEGAQYVSSGSETVRDDFKARECSLSFNAGPSVEIRVFRVGEKLVCTVSGNAPVDVKNATAEAVRRRVNGVQVRVQDRGSKR